MLGRARGAEELMKQFENSQLGRDTGLHLSETKEEIKLNLLLVFLLLNVHTTVTQYLSTRTRKVC